MEPFPPKFPTFTRVTRTWSMAWISIPQWCNDTCRLPGGYQEIPRNIQRQEGINQASKWWTSLQKKKQKQQKQPAIWTEFEVCRFTGSLYPIPIHKLILNIATSDTTLARPLWRKDMSAPRGFLLETMVNGRDFCFLAVQIRQWLWNFLGMRNNGLHSSKFNTPHLQKWWLEDYFDLLGIGNLAGALLNFYRVFEVFAGLIAGPYGDWLHLIPVNCWVEGLSGFRVVTRKNARQKKHIIFRIWFLKVSTWDFILKGPILYLKWSVA